MGTYFSWLHCSIAVLHIAIVIDGDNDGDDDERNDEVERLPNCKAPVISG